MASKEGEYERFPFTFDIHCFERTLENELFSVNKVFSEEEIIDVIFSSYSYALVDKALAKEKQFFVDTLGNGINPAKMVSEKVPGAKIILMKRNLESLLYANAGRIMSYQDEVKVNAVFKRILYNQKEFQDKMTLFHKEAADLQVSNKNVMLVDFNSLILNTDNTMNELAKFIGIQYEPILAQPSINGEVIENSKMIGTINDDPYESLSNTEMNVLKYILFGYNRKYSIQKNISILLNTLKWRYINSIRRLMGGLLTAIIPSRILMRYKKISTRK